MMLRFLLILLFLAFAGFAGLAGYGYMGDLAPATTTRESPAEGIGFRS